MTHNNEQNNRQTKGEGRLSSPLSAHLHQPVLIKSNLFKDPVRELSTQPGRGYRQGEYKQKLQTGATERGLTARTLHKGWTLGAAACPSCLCCFFAPSVRKMQASPELSSSLFERKTGTTVLEESTESVEKLLQRTSKFYRLHTRISHDGGSRSTLQQGCTITAKMILTIIHFISNEIRIINHNYSK